MCDSLLSHVLWVSIPSQTDNVGEDMFVLGGCPFVLFGWVGPEWVQNQDLWTPCMGATAPENCNWPQKYFPISHNVYVVGPDVQRNPALTATGYGSWMRRSFCLYHTYTTSTSCSRSAEVCCWSFDRELPTLAGLGDCRVSSCILTATYDMTRSRYCGLQKISGGGGVGDFRGGVMPGWNAGWEKWTHTRRGCSPSPFM